MVELLLLGQHERAGRRYRDAQVNLCVMLATKPWRQGWSCERDEGGKGAERGAEKKPAPRVRDGLMSALPAGRAR